MNKNNPLMDNLVFETSKDINNMSRKIEVLYNEDESISSRFDSADDAWTKNKESMSKVMDSIEYDIHSIKKDIGQIIIKAEKIIIEFRNKSKQDKVDSLRKRIENQNFESFITKKRLLEIIKKEKNLLR